MQEPAGEALRLSEEQLYHLVFHQSNDAIFVVDAVRDAILEANPAACRMLGYSREELLALPVSAVHPNEMPRLRAFARSVIEHGHQWTDELTCLTRSGQRLPAEISASRVEIDGRPCMLALVRDVTERRRTETAQHLLAEVGRLLASSLDHEATLQHVVRLAVPALADWCVVDLLDNGQLRRLAVAHADPAAAALADQVRRLAPDAQADNPVAKALHTGQPQLVPEVTDAWLEAYTRDSEHLRTIRAVGPRSLMAVPLPARGRVLGAIWFVAAESCRRYGPEDLALVVELAERCGLAIDNARLYQQAMRGEGYRRQLEMVADNATLALFIMDERQHCTYMNPAAERLTGFTLAEVQVRQLHEVIHHTRPDGTPYPLAECPIDRAFPQVMRAQGEEVFIHKDGHFYPVAFTASPIRDGDRTVGTIIEVQDITERKRLEEQREHLLKEVETERARLRDLFMQAPALICVLRGPEHVFDLANPLYVQSTGRGDASEIVGKPVREALPEVEGQGYFELLDQVYQTGEPFVGTEALVKIDRRGDGTLEDVYVNFVYQPTRDARGEVDGILVHAVDVTEQVRARHRAEELAAQLAEERERFAAIFSQATVGISETDLDGRFVLVNDRYCEIVGRPREELLALRLQDLTHPDDLPENLALLERMLATGEAFVIEKRYVRPDGVHVWVSNAVSLVRDAEGTPRYVVAVSTDVTDRRWAEAALRASEARSAFLAEASRLLGASFEYETTLANVAQLAVPQVADWCVVDVLDAQGTLRRLAVTHVDPAKVRLAHELQERYPPDPSLNTGPVYVGRTGEPELVPEIPDGLLERAARDPEHLALLRRLGLRSYMSVPMRVREQILGAITFVAAESGRRFGPEDLAVAEELARRAAVAIENAWLYAQAQEAIRVRDDFLAAASHDLKNPLGSIRGNAQLLLRTLERKGAVPPERLTSALTNMIGGADQMTGQINELLDVSRLRLGQPLPLDRAPTDLVALARRAVAAHQAATERHHFELRTQETELVGEWDAARLERVLGNLLSNAVKYSPGGGEITVTVSREASEAEEAGDRAVLAVRDRGIGIPAADLPRIFERFERAQNVVGRIGGSGIGLAAAKQIAEQHGGTIAVESHEGQGTTFTARLPLAAPTPPGPPGGIPSERPGPDPTNGATRTEGTR